MEIGQFQQQKAAWAGARQAGPVPPNSWNEQIDPDSGVRPHFEPVLQHFAALVKSELRSLSERMAATMREMDVSFNISRANKAGGSRRRPWDCDLIPHVFAAEEWDLVERGINQRLKAFECFLRDIYGRKDILHHGSIPIRAVLGSPAYLHAAIGVIPSADWYLHLCGLVLARDRKGRLAVKAHAIQRGSGISYMIQNRRILSRVYPDLFVDQPVASLADVPLDIMLHLHEMAGAYGRELNAVLLTPGPGSSAYSEHSFLARRMGLQLAQGGDLVVLGDKLYLKVVGGLEQVDVIYNRLAHASLDPLVCRRDSLIGVPGIIHCLRRRTVAMVNGLGSELADDRGLLCFAPHIIRFYLGEAPLLPTIETLWLGDIDQRELVLADLENYHIRPLIGDDYLGNVKGLPATTRDQQQIRNVLRIHPENYVAQRLDEGGSALCIEGSRYLRRMQDHVVFALRKEKEFAIFPGALTRISCDGGLATSIESGGGSKDSWVFEPQHGTSQHPPATQPLMERFQVIRKITSRVAESFYWLGRYLERLNSLAYMIQVIEWLELEELNAAERKHYRPIWSRLLPPVEGGGSSRRSLGSRADRYALLLRPGVSGSAAALVQRICQNADSIQEFLTPEAWSVLAELRQTFGRVRFREGPTDSEMVAVTRRLAERALKLVPQFSAVAEMTLLADEGFFLCQVGGLLERAVVTSNAVLAVHSAFRNQMLRPKELEHATEIELSAFLRMLGTRDAYRRLYQMRAQPLQVLEMLWQSREAPRSVLYALSRCADLLRKPQMVEAQGTGAVLQHVEAFVALLGRITWPRYFKRDADGLVDADALHRLLQELFDAVCKTHELITDSFLSHQGHIEAPDQSMLRGLSDGF